MSLKTPLYAQHQAAGAKIVDFAGWQMPLHYGSQLAEHQQVRQDAGVFDVSHMAAVDIVGRDAQMYLRYLLANDVAKLKTIGKALYTCMLNEQGGILDDLIVYWMGNNYYRLIINAGTREKDLAWLNQQSKRFKVELRLRSDLALLAVQGPKARAKIHTIFNAELANAAALLTPFQSVAHDDWLVARTGYTGEDGYEIMLPVQDVAAFWQKLLQADIKPCGLGARDTLRLEAGLNLYGTDMDETTTPLEANLAWTIAWEPADREFIGRKTLEQQKAQGVPRYLVGLVLKERGVLRGHQKVIIPEIGEGEITSGSFSPTLNYSIALARVPAKMGTDYFVLIRDKKVPVQLVKPPFVRFGKQVYEPLVNAALMQR
ncbi:MAG: glycine cleavage system aminomethyltransferase GcvT [Gammaproteobacteria bacterium]